MSPNAAVPTAAHVDAPPLCIRRVSPADAPAMQAYLAGLDPDSRRLRFHAAVNPASPSLLRLLTGVDDPRHRGFVAVQVLNDGEVIVGEAQCFVANGDSCAEFAISVAAAQRGSGLAGELMAAVLAAAQAAGVESVHGDVLAGNARMSAFMAHQGFMLDAGAETEPGVARFTRVLAPASAPAGAGAGALRVKVAPAATGQPWWQRLLRRRAMALGV